MMTMMRVEEKMRPGVGGVVAVLVSVGEAALLTNQATTADDPVREVDTQ